MENSQAIVEVMKKTMAKARKISVTTDLWSNKLGVDSCIGITCHFVNPETHKRHTYEICMLSIFLFAFFEFNSVFKVVENLTKPIQVLQLPTNSLTYSKSST